MPNEKWVSVYQYSKLIGKSKYQVYFDIRTGKLPKERVRRQDITVNRIQILVDNLNEVEGSAEPATSSKII